MLAVDFGWIVFSLGTACAYTSRRRQRLRFRDIHDDTM